MRLLIFLGVAIALSGCAQTPEKVAVKSSTEPKVGGAAALSLPGGIAAGAAGTAAAAQVGNRSLTGTMGAAAANAAKEAAK